MREGEGSPMSRLEFNKWPVMSPLNIFAFKCQFQDSVMSHVESKK